MAACGDGRTWPDRVSVEQILLNHASRAQMARGNWFSLSVQHTAASQQNGVPPDKTELAVQKRHATPTQLAASALHAQKRACMS